MAQKKRGGCPWGVMERWKLSPYDLTFPDVVNLTENIDEPAVYKVFTGRPKELYIRFRCVVTGCPGHARLWEACSVDTISDGAVVAIH